MTVRGEEASGGLESMCIVKRWGPVVRLGRLWEVMFLVRGQPFSNCDFTSITDNVIVIASLKRP